MEESAKRNHATLEETWRRYVEGIRRSNEEVVRQSRRAAEEHTSTWKTATEQTGEYFKRLASSAAVIEFGRLGFDHQHPLGPRESQCIGMSAAGGSRHYSPEGGFGTIPGYSRQECLEASDRQVMEDGKRLQERSS
jgi:hypothetical protein